MDAQTLVWTIGFPLFLFFIAVGIGTTFSINDSESIGFWVARICFIATTITLIGFCVYWLLNTKIAFPLTLTLGAALGCGSIPALMISLLWINATETRLSTRLIPFDLPSPTLPSALAKRASDVIPSNALKVFLGTNIAWATKMPHNVLVMNGDPMITINWDPLRKQLAVSNLKIFDDRDNIIARIDEDGFWVENSTRRKRPNPGTLVVYDHTDTEVLKIVLLNQTSVAIKGIFRHSGVARPVTVTDEFMDLGGARGSFNIMGEAGFADILIGPPILNPR